MVQNADRLTNLPNIGKAIANDRMSLGIQCPSQLAGSDPLETFNELAVVMDYGHDPCVLYTVMSLKYFLDKGQALPWWKFTAEGKKLLATKKKRSRL